MKKSVTAFLLAIVFLPAEACDICGNVNHLNPYLFPHLSKSYISLAYLRNRYHSTEDGIPATVTNNTVLLSGQYTLSSRLQVVGLLPYHFTQTDEGAYKMRTTGVGDVTLLANYNALRLQTGGLKHNLSLGAGLKLPTGDYDAGSLADVNNENLRLGTGSLDYLAHAAYRISRGNFTLSAAGLYKYTTPNKSGYRYGDVLTTSATAVYVVNLKNLALTPYVQLTAENHYRDAGHHVLQNASGGSVLYTGGGFDLSTAKLTVGFNYQAAARQDLMQGELVAKPKFSARLSFTL